MKLLAFIPARGGSKGILKKNTRLFDGQPLIAYAIQCAKQSAHVDRVFVSTDDQDTAEIAKGAGADVPFLRPSELAGDKSKVVDAVVDALERLKRDEGYAPTHLLLLQTTSPLREAADIDRAVELYVKRGADSLVSVCRTENLLLTKDTEDRLTILNPDLLKTTNRQELPAFYKLDGCMIYLVRVPLFLETHSFLAGKLIGYEIPRWRAVDLDDPQDFVVGELVHAHAKELKKSIENFR